MLDTGYRRGMGKFPKYIKPRTNFPVIIVTAWLTLLASASAAESGQAAIKRGHYGAAAAQFMVRAERNDPVAQNNLGALYLKGRGVPQNYDLARSWFEKAADNQLAGAMFNLGMLYLRGYGVEPNEEQATIWFKRSAEAGDREGQFFLGVHKYYGRGTQRDTRRRRPMVSPRGRAKPWVCTI